MDVPARPPRRRSTLRLAPLLVAGCVVAAGFVRSLRADDGPPAFSLGGRPVSVPRAGVIEPFSSPTPIPATPTPEHLAPSPTDAPAFPVELDAGRSADLAAPDAPSDSAVAQASGAVELASPDRPIAHTSGVEPALIAPPSAPLVIYQPVPVAGPAGPTDSHSDGDRLALLAAGFAAGVLATFAFAGLPVAIALRRPVVWPRSALAAETDPSTKTPRTPDAPLAMPPAAAEPPAPTLAEQLDATRAAEQDARRRRSAALLQTVLDNNLALQAELQRREARQGDSTESRAPGAPDGSRAAPPSHPDARKPETDR